jgi:hypothetical protein
MTVQMPQVCVEELGQGYGSGQTRAFICMPPIAPYCENREVLASAP